MNCLSCLLILRTYGPYLSTLEIATIRKLFAARTTSAECSALVVRNCHAAQLGRVYGPRSCNSNIIWLWLEGPAIVPGQDTRITAIIISVGKSLAAFSISLAIGRSAWASVLPWFLNGN